MEILIVLYINVDAKCEICIFFIMLFALFLPIFQERENSVREFIFALVDRELNGEFWKWKIDFKVITVLPKSFLVSPVFNWKFGWNMTRIFSICFKTNLKLNFVFCHWIHKQKLDLALKTCASCISVVKVQN